MPADQPTILATSGGRRPGQHTRFEFSELVDYAIDLSGVHGRAPRMCMLATAVGDDAATIAQFYDMARVRGVHGSHLLSFPMPNVEDATAHLLDQDVVWVFGGSVAGLLAMWRLLGYGEAMRTAWQAGVVLTGVSAGSICWHVGGTTDSYGRELRAVTDGLALVPYSNGVHYDNEPQRRPLLHRLIADGTLPTGYATDDGVGVVYRGTEFAEAVTEADGKSAYRIERSANGTAVETQLDTRRL